ncbi:MAG: RNA-binding S4 domain-containing protein [Planctomycetes bacterium]|nr:RNA-binding S4 domain-containing protein [Planctomycetota bacterium]
MTLPQHEPRPPEPPPLEPEPPEPQPLEPQPPPPYEPEPLREGPIRLDQFLKLKGKVHSGGEAKHKIQAGEILVNGEVETRRGRKLARGDKVTVEGVTVEV